LIDEIMMHPTCNPVEPYGAPDTALDKFGIDQKGAIKEFLTNLCPIPTPLKLP
jgi:hypothetical protein